MERTRTSTARTRLAEEIFIPGRVQARGWKEEPYKKWSSTQKLRLEFNILGVTICEQKACNRVNVDISISSLIVRCNFSFFHKTLSQQLRRWTSSTHRPPCCCSLNTAQGRPTFGHNSSLFLFRLPATTYLRRQYLYYFFFNGFGAHTFFLRGRHILDNS